MQLFIKCLLNASYVPITVLGTAEDMKVSKKFLLPLRSSQYQRGEGGGQKERERKRSERERGRERRKEREKKKKKTWMPIILFIVLSCSYKL